MLFMQFVAKAKRAKPSQVQRVNMVPNGKKGDEHRSIVFPQVKPDILIANMMKRHNA
jgi:hypothetical protein